MIDHIIHGARAIRDTGSFLLGAVALYSFVRVQFEYRGALTAFATGIWYGRDLTATGNLHRKRMFGFAGLSVLWFFGWSMVLIMLFLLFPENSSWIS